MDKNQIGKKLDSPLPRRIDFSIDESKNLLRVSMNETGIRDNMQTDSSSFEGWIFCILSVIPNIKLVELDWEPVKYSHKESTEKRHYTRFLLRVLAFKEMYSWFNVAQDKEFELFLIKELLNSGSLILNYPTTIAKENVDSSKKPEADLERQLKRDWGKNNPNTDQQLPVGIFKGNKARGNNITPCGASQIDLWQLDGDILNIFELKIESNCSVGIISELMFYTEVMYFLMKGLIQYPDDAIKKGKYRNFEVLYKAFKNHTIKQIKGWLTAKKFHNLIQNNKRKIIELMNENSYKIEYGFKEI